MELCCEVGGSKAVSDEHPIYMEVVARGEIEGKGARVELKRSSLFSTVR